MGLARTVAYAVAGFICCALVASPAALATTAVSGTTDSTSPLVIDPKTSPTDALSLRLDVGGAPEIAVVERMPVTKEIEKVTLGDLQADAGDCGSPAQLRVSVAEHPPGNLDDFEPLTYSDETPDAPAASGPVTWTLHQKITLKQGYGYSFHVQSANIGTCRYVYQTTWAHNSDTVDSGSSTCTIGPVIGEGSNSYMKRQWHTYGQFDGVRGPQGCDNGGLEPPMPTGWLVSFPVAAGWNIAQAWKYPDSPVGPGFSACNYNGEFMDDVGGRQVEWQEEPDDGKLHWVCMWTQFNPPGVETSDGWYFGRPWRKERIGRPRDVYLKAGEDTAPPPPTKEELAKRFEPVLRFDTSEQWRPLNVHEFFAEGNHHVCDGQLPPPKRCFPITSEADLARHATPSSYLNVFGDFRQIGDERDFHSPYPECQLNGLRECDTGSRSAIYYGFNEPVDGGYQYIDYWAFYRANYFYRSIDFHEGDWEGVTIAPSLDKQTFDYAAVSQHGPFYSYLRDVLRCEETPAVDPAPAGTCGTDLSPSGRRLDVMVANGSHANYTSPCSEVITALTCKSTGSWHNFERGYDGKRRWGRAFDDPATSLLPMPHVDGRPWTSSWTDWPGAWGSPGHGIATEDGPPSPGNQAINFSCAEYANPPGCIVPPSRGPTVGAKIRADRGGRPALARTVHTSPGLAALSCESWVGAGITAAACNPGALRKAVLHRRLGAPGSVSIATAGTRGVAAAAPGIAQFSSRRALSSDAQIVIRGQVRRSTRVFVRAFDQRRKHVIVAKFRVGKARPALIAASRRGATRLRLMVTGTGAHARATLGGVGAASLKLVH